MTGGAALSLVPLEELTLDTMATYMHKIGALGGGNDIEKGSYTVKDAKMHASKLPACAGFTFCHGGKMGQAGGEVVEVFFKSSDEGNGDPAWQTWTKGPIALAIAKKLAAKKAEAETKAAGAGAGAGKGKGKGKGKGRHGREDQAQREQEQQEQQEQQERERQEEADWQQQAAQAQQMYQKAIHLYKQKALPEAEGMCNSALGVLSSHSEAASLLSKVKASLAEAEDCYKRAQKCATDHQLPAAEQLCKQALNVFPAHSRAQQLEARVREEQKRADGHHDQALRLFNARQDFAASQDECLRALKIFRGHALALGLKSQVSHGLQLPPLWRKLLQL